MVFDPSTYVSDRVYNGIRTLSNDRVQQLITSYQRNFGVTMEILETQFKQRAYDGKWERVCRIIDKENAYSFTNEYGIKSTYTPTKWVTLGVYDLLGELELADGTKY